MLPKPLTVDQALSVVDSWFAQGVVTALSPGPEHWRILRDLVAETGSAGNVMTDAHLAALTIEHAAELCSTDTDFGRFPTLRWVNPLDRG